VAISPLISARKEKVFRAKEGGIWSTCCTIGLRGVSVSKPAKIVVTWKGRKKKRRCYGEDANTNGGVHGQKWGHGKRGGGPPAPDEENARA